MRQAQLGDIMQVLDRVASAVSLIDADGTVVHRNAAAEAVLAGLAVGEALDESGTQLFGADLPHEHTRLTGEPCAGRELGFLRADGERRWLRLSTQRLSEEGPPYPVVASYEDVTHARATTRELERATKLFSTAFAEAPIGMALVGLDGRWLQVNRAVCALTGFSEAELLSKTFQEITHPDDLDADLEHVGQLVAGEIDTYSTEKRYLTAGGRLIWVNLCVALVRAPDGTPEHFISQIEDITERKRLEEQLQQLADHDPLTGLGNRRLFGEELERQLGRCRRYDEQGAVLLLDLDDFKQVNDTLGHKAGDDLLCGVAAAMSARLRSNDTLARLGGDEFAVLLTHVGPDEAAVLANEFVRAIRGHPVRVHDHEIAATASIGVAFLDGEVESGEAALMAADIAMYAAKAAGRDRASLQPRRADAQQPARYGRGAGADAAIATVRHIYAAFERRDIDAVLEHAATDIEIMPAGTAARIGRTEPYRGHAGVRRYFADAAGLWEDMRIAADDFRATATGVVVFGEVAGIAGGEPVRRRVVWVWQVVAGKATSMRVTDIGETGPAD